MIVLKNISKTYNEGSADAVHALKNVDLTVNDGEMLAVMGVSGSGKSTLLHIIGCLDRASSGEYELDGENISKAYMDKLNRLRNEKIGFVLQDYGLIEDKTVLENVMFPLAFSKYVSYKEMKTRARNTLSPLGIADLEKKRVSRLSGGQKQRTAIARAIVNDPSLILADEPTAALDRHTADEIMSVFTSLSKSKKRTVIIVTHDKRIADMCDRTLYISDGVLTENES
ncbi:ABC transporter ATP-binding protein [uncultured Ruminococcus sp.]|uniref:ABC transporter ATP-binding protein n=1 Tax=uncultured Ruminococcus sp. TaxID=165186 RepID=UPI0025F5FA3E|nr:ABC transporter ATP-binding protein [uncultured Ruminococcus sp.]